MRLPKSLTTVTPLSKFIALFMFISLPFIGFCFGYQYRQSIIMPEIITKPMSLKQKVDNSNDQRDLNSICGDFPDLPVSTNDKFIRKTGPQWSHNCRLISWASWQSGAMGMVYDGPLEHEGLFVYDYITKKTKTLYTPKVSSNSQETIELQNWLDSNQIVFTKDGQKNLYVVNLENGEISEFVKD